MCDYNTNSILVLIIKSVFDQFYFDGVIKVGNIYIMVNVFKKLELLGFSDNRYVSDYIWECDLDLDNINI